MQLTAEEIIKLYKEGNLKFYSLTVREIINMIDRGELNYNQSTQRKFLYAELDCQLGGNAGKTTKSGALINDILYNKGLLPAVYFWHNTDTGNMNIHDGKQRILSLYYFITGKDDYKISVPDNAGKPQVFNSLSEEQQQYLLDYKLVIIELEGNNEAEERSFYTINTRGVPLTDYEAISGMNYGTYLKGLEDYIQEQSKILDKIKPIGRGEQAIKFLKILMGISINSHGAKTADIVTLINDRLRQVRNATFNSENLHFNTLIQVVNKLISFGINEDNALGIAQYVLIENDWINEVNKILKLYERAFSGSNDIKSWKISTHKVFIDKYLLDNVELDATRFFTKDIKDILWDRSTYCAKCGVKHKYSDLEVDHILAWSTGGKTSLNNAQLLCKSCNCSKSNS